jgi:hypothetical protein
MFIGVVITESLEALRVAEQCGLKRRGKSRTQARDVDTGSRHTPRKSGRETQLDFTLLFEQVAPFMNGSSRWDHLNG